MKYSERLLKTSSLLLNGELLADIGCDHGYVCIMAVDSGKFRRAFACDVADGPLERAKQNIISAGYSDKIKTILSDGFKNVPEQPDCAVICGMGGLLIRRILIDGKRMTDHMNQLILGPHSEIAELRRYILNETCFGIIRETTLLDSNKYYTLMDIRRVSKEKQDSIYLTDLSMEFGCPENQTDIASYLKYLMNELTKNEKAYTMASNGSGKNAKEKADILLKKVSDLKLLIGKAEGYI